MEKVVIIKETSWSDHSQTAAVTLPVPGTVTAGTKAPSQQLLQCSDGAWLPPHPHSHSHWFPDRLDPKFPAAGSLTSLSTKQFIHGALTQKQLELVPPGRDPQQRSPGAFTPSHAKHGKSEGLGYLDGPQVPFVMLRDGCSRPPGWGSHPLELEPEVLKAAAYQDTCTGSVPQ